MSFAERLVELRKKRGISQEVLANELGTKGPAIGRYERGMAKPTIDVAAKIARILGVSLDYLVGNSDIEVNKDTLKRLQDIENLPTEDKSNILYTIDGLIKAAKLKAI